MSNNTQSSNNTHKGKTRNNKHNSINSHGNSKDVSSNNSDGSSDKFSKKIRLSFRGNKKEKKDKSGQNNIHHNSNESVHEEVIKKTTYNSVNSLKDQNKKGGKFENKVIQPENDNEENSKCISDKTDSEVFAREIVINLIENMWKSDHAVNNQVKKSDVKLRNNKNVDKTKKTSHRRTSVTEVLQPDDLNENVNQNAYKRDPSRRDSLYSVEEFDENFDENDNKLHQVEAVNLNVKSPKDPVKKKNSFFNSLFRKKTDKKDNRQFGMRKYSSTLELSSLSNQTKEKPFERSPSFIKRKLSKLIKEDTPALIKRSLSVRDVSKRKESNLTAEMQWKKSLQSLVENDNSVSYDDMSFINYDTLNTVTYRDKDKLGVSLHRTQSLIVHGSPANYKPSTIRGASVPPHYLSSTDISEQSEAQSLPSLHQAIQENEEINLQVPQCLPRFRRRPQSLCSEDGKPKSQTNGSFRSAGNGCAKLKRTNACRQKSRNSVNSIDEEIRYSDTNSKASAITIRASNRVRSSVLFDTVKLFTTKNLKIAREHLSVEHHQEDSAEGKQPHEWCKLVGSIRRKVQRHGSSSAQQRQEASPQVSPSDVNTQGITRKNSLTQSRFDFFKRSKDETSTNKGTEKNGKVKGLTRQKSVEQSPSPKVQDYFKGLTSKDKSKSVSVRNVYSCASSPTTPSAGLGIVKSGKKSDKTGCQKKSASKKDEKSVSKDDFLKATMRIFLVVSPPVGKIQARSRSLNHLDTLEMRYGAPSSPDAALKDSRSEPDCTKPLLAPPDANIEPPASPTTEIQTSKRHVLTRSQKSSSECFSVNFEVGDESTWENELFFPATRGVTLHESLAKLCELRSIDLSNCDAWLQDKEANTNSLLHFSQDTANLVGRHIRITAKDTGAKRSSLSQSRKYSGSTRQKSSSFFSSSTEDNVSSSPYSTWSSHDAKLSFQDTDGSKKQGKQRWSGLFGNNKDTKMEALVEHLNSYTKHGVPASQIYPQGQCESLDALYKLETDWREIIDYEELTEKQQQQQTALWELIKTEVAYIKTLKVVTELFLACLKNLQSVNLLKEIDTEKLFSNITEILDTNVQFWRNSLFPMVKTMRQYRQPPCIEMMAQGFLGMRDSFRAYYQYCAEQARCQHYCRENHAHNELFTAYLAWCETQKECNRLRLMDILVQPMQRLTKYGLLLKAILKNTDEEVEKDTLYLMIRSVDDFVNKVNSSLKQKQDSERLRGLIVRIESYDIVESKDDDLERLLKTYNPLDLTRPMVNCPIDRRRHLLLEGDLKLKDSITSKMEVHCFLLTDMLLVCKPSTKRGGSTMRVIRQPYLVDRLAVHELNRETPSLALIYKNEFDMAVAGFILQNNDAKKLKSWKDGIAKAQLLYSQAKQPAHYEESLDADYAFTGDTLESDYHSFQLAPKSPLASSSRASRVSSLAHSHSGSVEMNDQSSIGSGKDHSRAVSVENENRTASISSDEGVQPLPPDRSPVSQKNSFKQRLFNKTPNTLTVQPYTNLGQSLPNLTLGSPNIGTLSLNLNQNTLSVPNAKNNTSGGAGSTHLLSPTHRGISYPPPSPTRGNLRRGLAISQSKNPPLQKTRHVSSQASTTSCGQVPSSFDFDVPVIAGILQPDHCESFSRGQLRQAMVKRGHRTENKRYHTAGTVDDIKRFDNRDPSIHKRLSWNYGSHGAPPSYEEET